MKQYVNLRGAMPCLTSMKEENNHAEQTRRPGRGRPNYNNTSSYILSVRSSLV